MKKIIIITAFLALGAAIITGCASLTRFMTGSTTSLQSTSLATASLMRAQGIKLLGITSGGNWLITPEKISGKIMSVVLPINGTEDDGVVPFGSGRPDIAPANTTLYDFDLSTTTSLHSDSMGLKPGFKGGQVNQIILLFGYFDVEFKQGANTKIIRFVYGDTDPYVRGDKLLYNANGATDGKYYWYDTTAGTFVSESSARPASPSKNTYVSSFSDPVRPEMHYYMLGANLKNCTDYDGATRDYITLTRALVEDNELYFTVDFDVANAVVFTGVTTEPSFDALSDADLIQKFDMKQNTSGWGDTELDCSINLNAVAKFK